VGGGGRAPAKDEFRGAKDSIPPAAEEEIPIDKSNPERSNDPALTPREEGHDAAATPGQEEYPPAPTSANAGESVPVHGKFPANNPDSMRPSGAASPTPQDTDSQWKPAPPNEDNPQTSSFANAQDEGLTRAIKRVDLGTGQVRPPARPGHKSHSSATMFTNAHINAINGGTFNLNNVAHIYECDSPAQGGGPAFPIAMLGLQAVSFATRSHYGNCDRPFESVLLLMPEPTSTTNVALRFPVLYQEMKPIIGPLAVWFFIQMWIKRRAVEHH
jgi:hypothetical protein